MAMQNSPDKTYVLYLLEYNRSFTTVSNIILLLCLNLIILKNKEVLDQAHVASMNASSI